MGFHAMKRLTNATKAFIQETAIRLKLAPKELLALHADMETRDFGDEIFCACCLHLEQDTAADNELRSGLRLGASLLIEGKRAADARYGLLYYMIKFFYRNDPRTFLDTPGTALVPELSAMPWSALFGNADPKLECSVCLGPVRYTPSGWLCDKCGGGTERTKESLQSDGTIAPQLVPYLEGLMKPKEMPVQISDTKQALAAYVSDEEHDKLFGSKAAKKIIEYNKEPDIPWNAQQQKAFKEIFKWLKSDSRTRNPIYRLFGYAGTGKTSMAKKVAVFAENELKGYVMFAAYTGKAASVLRSKGCANSSTIHSLIYRPKIDRITGTIIGQEINRESPLREARLLIIDEASMVTSEMAMDLLSFGVPILVLGDPGQLPPPKGEGYFNTQTPDFMLTDIERQAEDNPIIWLATRARKGKRIKPGRYGESRVLSSNVDVSDTSVLRGQIICGTNRTRQAMNERYRKLKGYFDKDSQFPSKGERLICLKNNHDNGLLNGTMWTCTQPKIQPMKKPVDYRDLRKGYVQTNLDGLHFKVRSHDLFDSSGDPLIINTVCSAHMFDRNLPEPPWQDVAHCDQFDFGYAMTAHKAQGSQFDDGLIIDESWIFREDADKHLYTMLTRFVERVTVKQTEH